MCLIHLPPPFFQLLCFQPFIFTFPIVFFFYSPTHNFAMFFHSRIHHFFGYSMIFPMVDLKTTPVQVSPNNPLFGFSLPTTSVYTTTYRPLMVANFFSTSLPTMIIDSTTIGFALLLSSLPTTVNIGSYFSSLMVYETYRVWKSQFLDVLAIHVLQNLIAPNTRPLPLILLNGTPNPTCSYWLCANRLVLTWINVRSRSLLFNLCYCLVLLLLNHGLCLTDI